MTFPFKLGRNRPLARGPQLKARRYFGEVIPSQPENADYTAPAKDYLSEILGNDQLSNCTSAAAFHIDGTMLANAGKQIPYNLDQVINFYSLSTGYVRSDSSTDQGGDEITVLNCWQQHGLLGNGTATIAGWVALDGGNQLEVKACINGFENCLFGVFLPDDWINNFPRANGFVWDVVGPASQNNGHAFPGLGYTPQGVIIDTWGYLGIVTWAAVQAYASGGQGELYGTVSRDALNSANLLPSGINGAQMVGDFNSFFGASVS